MSLSVSRQRRRLRGIQMLSSLLEDYPNPEIVYIELWMLPRLFGQSGEMLMDYLRWFRVSLAVSVVPGCGVLIFIVGDPFCQYITMALIMTMACQLRIQRNRARAGARRLQNSARAWGRSV